jgi:DNA repair ATPase RecN
VDVEDNTQTQAAYAATLGDRDRTLRAVHRLESAMAMAAQGSTWSSEVMKDLRALGVAMAEEQRELDRPDALLAMIAAENPRRFGSRVRNLREQYADITRQLESLRDQLSDEHVTQLDPGDLRQRVGWIIRALHHCRARQTDLVYEAVSMDLGER